MNNAKEKVEPAQASKIKTDGPFYQKVKVNYV